MVTKAGMVQNCITTTQVLVGHEQFGKLAIQCTAVIIITEICTHKKMGIITNILAIIHHGSGIKNCKIYIRASSSFLLAFFFAKIIRFC